MAKWLRALSCLTIQLSNHTTISSSVFVIIDGNALLHRAYHAYPLSLRTSKGELVNAVYGFTRLLLKAVKDLNPAYLAITFDRPEPTFRHLDFVGYKAHRPKMDEELAGQIDRLHGLVESLGVAHFEVAGFEADDVIGTLVSKAKKSKEGGSLSVYIVTGDMDALQLVDRRVFVYAPTKGLSNPTVWDEGKVRRQYGFSPNQMADYKALRGDPSDAIPGVKGIGEKTAKDLIVKWGSLDNLYKHLSDVTPKSVAEKLAKEAEAASMSKNLATIRQDVPLIFKLKNCVFKGLDPVANPKINRIFEELEFHSLLRPHKTEKNRDDNQLKLI